MILESILHPITHYCSYQERCHSEVRQKLYALGARGEEIDEAIIYLIKENYLNEERYACGYARGHFRQKKWGKIKIANELKRKDIGVLLIKKALSTIDADEYTETLIKLITDKFATLGRDQNSYQRQQKVFRYLLQKGYESSMISNAFADLGL